MRLAAIMVGLSVSLDLCAPAFGQETPPEEDAPAVVIYGKWPAADACTPENTTAVRLADLLTNAQPYADRCISTVGWISGYALFLDPGDADLPHSVSNPASSGRRAGLYGSEATMERVWALTTPRARVVGKLWDCVDLDGPNVLMVMGYCHYTGGPFIGVVSIDPEK